MVRPVCTGTTIPRFKECKGSFCSSFRVDERRGGQIRPRLSFFYLFRCPNGWLREKVKILHVADLERLGSIFGRAWIGDVGESGTTERAEYLPNGIFSLIDREIGFINL